MGGSSPGPSTTPGAGFQKSSNWLLGQRGGVIPGPLGSPRKAVLHGGELVVPTKETTILRALLSLSGGNKQTGGLRGLLSRKLPESGKGMGLW